MTAPIRILICDDHALVRSGLHKLLECEPDLEVVGEAANADEAIDRSRSDAPDVLLLDVVMPGRSGIDALPDILGAAPATKVLMLSMQNDPVYVRNAFAAGASGYVLKDAAGTELVEAIHTVVRRRGAMSTRCSVLVLPRPRRPPRARALAICCPIGSIRFFGSWPWVTPTRRSPKQLFLSVRTVETHRARIVHEARA